MNEQQMDQKLANKLESESKDSRVAILGIAGAILMVVVVLVFSMAVNFNIKKISDLEHRVEVLEKLELGPRESKFQLQFQPKPEIRLIAQD